MSIRPIHLYIGAVGTAALAILARLDWSIFNLMPSRAVLGFAVLVLMAVFSEALAVRLSVGKSAGSTSVTFIPLLASVQLFGPDAAILLIGIGTLFADFIVQRKGLERGLFNVAQVIVAASAAGVMFAFLGGTALGLPGAGSAHLGGDQLLPFLGFGLVFLIVNHAAVSLAISLSQALRFSKVWEHLLGRSGILSHQDLLISPISIIVTLLYLQIGPAGIVVAFLPLFFIRHAYLNAIRLKEANTALLKALVKAIETRDPYTSGHSLRVAHLARQIAERIGLSRGAVEGIEQAALLHDVGKIEPAYISILSKPSSLTPEERSIIESHVIKGEELLRNLSSFSEALLLTVRHHHERQDGNGYPDRLRGDEIPLGAQIVAVCDAVDAMLSDRPYRKALSLDVVMARLEQNAGWQFSSEIVGVLVTSGLVKEYSELVGSWDRSGESDSAFEMSIPSDTAAIVPRHARANLATWYSRVGSGARRHAVDRKR